MLFWNFWWMEGSMTFPIFWMKLNQHKFVLNIFFVFFETSFVLGFYLKPSWLVVSWNYVEIRRVIVKITPSIIKIGFRRNCFAISLCFKERRIELIEWNKVLKFSCYLHCGQCHIVLVSLDIISYSWNRP